jgi:hypothetical protein
MELDAGLIDIQYEDVDPNCVLKRGFSFVMLGRSRLPDVIPLLASTWCTFLFTTRTTPLSLQLPTSSCANIQICT